MDEKKQKFIDETNAYIKKKKTTYWICTGFIIAAVVFIFISLALIKDQQTKTVFFAIGFFLPAVYTLPSAIKFIIKNTPEVEPSYDLYINSEGKIYAKEDAYTQGQRAGNALFALLVLIVTSFLGLIRVFIIAMTCWGQIKRAEKQLKLANV